MLPRFSAILAVLAALASVQAANNSALEGCSAVDYTTIDPPDNAFLVFTLEARGVRNFTCIQGGHIGKESAVANVSGYTYSGLGYYNQLGQPVVDLVDATSGEPAGRVVLELEEPRFITQPAPDNASFTTWGRWAVAETTGSLPPLSWMTRTHTSGGAKPQDCSPPEAVLTSDYTADYNFFACEAPSPSPTGVAGLARPPRIRTGMRGRMRG